MSDRPLVCEVRFNYEHKNGTPLYHIGCRPPETVDGVAEANESACRLVRGGDAPDRDARACVFLYKPRQERNNVNKKIM